MMKDIDWLKSQSEITDKQVSDFLHSRGMVAIDKAMYFKDELANKMVVEKPEVPQYVADWIEEQGAEGWWRVIGRWKTKIPESDRKVYDWFLEFNEDRLIIAWVTGEYNVKKEMLYYAQTKLASLLHRSEDRYILYEKDMRGATGGVEHTGLEYADKRTLEDWYSLGINEDNVDFVSVEWIDNE